MLVLKWFLGSLKNQQYAGRKEDDGVKKPLNAFLGELFIGSWKDEKLGETKLISEQVSHHPPVTACYLWNDKHEIRAEGFTQQEITFSGSVNIKQKGYAVLHIDKYDENYLIPVPNVKVKGILGGVPYPELQGEYSLISSNGYVSNVKFEGKGFFGTGQKNAFEARMFHIDQPKEDLYTVQGAWNGVFTATNSRTGEEIETFDTMALQSLTIDVQDIAEQDPWESRKAWGDVIAALRRSDMRGTTDAKSIVEEGQRQMRKDEEAQGTQWKNVFFQSVDQDPIFSKLAAHDESSFAVDPAGGIWKVDQDAVKNAKKPYHGNLVPSNKSQDGVMKATPKEGNSLQKSNNSQEGPRNENAIRTTPSQSSAEPSALSSPSQQIAPKPEAEQAKDPEDRSDNGNGGTWQTFSNNVSTLASTISSKIQGDNKTAGATISGQQPDNVALEEQPRVDALTSPKISDRQVEEFLRAKTANS